jgi:hypothetical protein
MASRTNRSRTAASVRSLGAGRPRREAGVFAWPGIVVAVLGPGISAAAAAEPAVGPQRVVNQQVVQARNAFQAAAHAELELVRSICGRLPKQSRPAVAAAAAEGLERAAADFVKRQSAGRSGKRFDARQYVHDAVLPVLEPLVSEEELAAYRREHAARLARRARTARLQILDQLATTLDLSAAQAEAIAADLEDRWQPDWVAELEARRGLTVNGLRSPPDFASEAITPHLDERQRLAWDEWCLSQVRGHSGTRGWGGRSLDPDPWWRP